MRQCDAEQRREHQDLQDVVLGERIDHAGRDHVEQEIHDPGRLCCARRVACDGFGIERRRIDVHPLARLEDVNNDKADQERKGRQYFKIDERPHADASQLLHVFHSRDAEDDRREDDGREHHLDQLDERVAQRLQVATELRR